MKLFRRAKLLIGSGALALGALGGLTAAASPAHALTLPGPIPYHPPANAYMNASSTCRTFDIWGGGPAWTKIANSNDPYVYVTIYREDPVSGRTYVDTTFRMVTNYPGNPGSVSPWVVSEKIIPGEYYWAEVGTPSTYIAVSNLVLC